MMQAGRWDSSIFKARLPALSRSPQSTEIWCYQTSLGWKLVCSQLRETRWGQWLWATKNTISQAHPTNWWVSKRRQDNPSNSSSHLVESQTRWSRKWNPRPWLWKLQLKKSINKCSGRSAGIVKQDNNAWPQSPWILKTYSCQMFSARTINLHSRTPLGQLL